MFESEVLELAAIFGSIVGAWFAVIGWKLVPSDSTLPDPDASTEA
jgi:hypothetical protein